MPRHPLPLGSWGRIARFEESPGRWRATARFRDFDGRTRLIKAYGATGAAAERALVRSMRDRAAPSGTGITDRTRVSQLARVWLEDLEAEERVKPQTLDRYRVLVDNHINPGIGDLRLSEARAGRLDRFLRSVAERHPAQAQSVKQVLGQMFAVAVRHDAVAANPVREVGRLRSAKKAVRALETAQLEDVRRAVRLWRTVPDSEGRMPPGPRPTEDLADMIDLMLATGLRIGEVLALLWSDVDLAATPPRLEVTGTLVHVVGEGLVRQAAPKTSAGWRTLALPGFAVDVLLRRREQEDPNPLGAVFVTRTGNFVSPHNMRRRWRDARKGTGLEWVTPHTFRRTVATIIEREHGTKDASAQLGHASEAVTSKHYVERSHVAPDLTSTLDRLAGSGPDR